MACTLLSALQMLTSKEGFFYYYFGGILVGWFCFNLV